MSVECVQADSRAILQIMPSNSVDSIVTDPPYALVSIGKRFGAENAAPAAPGVYNRSARGFMGKTWDNGSTAFDPAFWFEALRVLKPGGHVLAFGGTRTYHRLACAIEDAGFEIRDQIGWLYGSGFPKSHNQKGDWEGWGTALKPAWEPIVVARKELDGTVAANLAKWGVGALNIDGCRIEASGRPAIVGDYKATVNNAYEGRMDGSLQGGSKAVGTTDEGRWPANIVHDGSDEVIETFPTAPGQIAKASSSSDARKTQNVYGAMKRGRGDEPSADSENEGPVGFKMRPGARRGDAGSAARFFKETTWSDEEWLLQFLHCIGASTAVSLSNPQSVLDAFAQSDAVTWALPAGTRLNASSAPSTNVTPNELKKLLLSVTEMTMNFVSEFLLEPQREKHIQTKERVRIAALKTPIGTMTITISHWRSDGSADPVTLTITSLNMEVGGLDSRFRYAAKASRADRNDGLDALPEKPLLWSAGTQNPGSFQSEGTNKAARNPHPTVKPTELMRWLCRLVTPPGGLVLDPFMGSGSTGRGAVMEGFRFLGVEMEAEYVEIAKLRIAAAQPKGVFG